MAKKRKGKTSTRRSYMETIRVLSRAVQFVAQGFMSGAAYTVGGGLLSLFCKSASRRRRTLGRPAGAAATLQYRDQRCQQDPVHLLRPRRWRKHRGLERADRARKVVSRIF